MLARIAEPDRPGPGAGDGRGGLVSGHGMRTDFLRFCAIGSAFVRDPSTGRGASHWAMVPVRTGFVSRTGQISCCSTLLVVVVGHGSSFQARPSTAASVARLTAPWKAIVHFTMRISAVRVVSTRARSSLCKPDSFVKNGQRGRQIGMASMSCANPAAVRGANKN